MDLKESDILGDAAAEHWYYVSKGQALRQYLGGLHVEESLDVGAGSGVFSRQLLDAGVCDRALCVDPYYTEERTESHHGKPIAFVRSVGQVSQKLILLMDVLEHVDDDVALLKQYTAAMPADATVLISVPAFPFLWSSHDVFLEHRRRYTIPSLQKTVEAAGLEVVKMHYFFLLLFPVAALLRTVKNRLLKGGALKAKSELSIAPPWLNALLIAGHQVEQHLFFPMNKTAGLTLFCMCRKPQDAAYGN